MSTNTNDASGPCSCTMCTSIAHSCYLPNGPTATLDNANLWRKFEQLGTEMVITKRGRRLFPPLKVKLRGLVPDAKYVLWLDVVPVDSSRYKFVNSQWMAVGPGEIHTSMYHVHSSVAISGRCLMKDVVSFHTLKLTNQKEGRLTNQILLNSMHKYIPRIHVTSVDNFNQTFTFSFDETMFMAVTAYQNEDIIQLKINNNPFAKGFRETNSPRKPRKRSIENDEDLNKPEFKKPTTNSSISGLPQFPISPLPLPHPFYLPFISWRKPCNPLLPSNYCYCSCFCTY